MLKLDIIFSGLGITKRNDIYISRSLNSFGELLNNINGLPILLDHPTNMDNFNKDLLNTNTDFSIIGNVEEVISYDDNSIRVKANITDPYFKEFYNSLTEEQKQNIETSPAVTSELLDEIDINGFKVFNEKITSLDHLAILLPEFEMLNGYWSKYVDDYMVKDIIEENNSNVDEKIQHNINNIIYGDDSMIGTVESTAHIDNNVELQEEVKEIVEDIVEAQMGEGQEQVEEFKEEVKEESIDSEELIEEKKEETICDSDEDIKEEVKEDIVSEETKEEAGELSEEQVAHIVEEVKEIQEIMEQPVEEVKEEVVEEEKIDEDEIKEEDLISEDYETTSDKEKEIIVKMVSNLIDSIEGFRKPVFKERVKASVYLKKALNLNKEFIDSKYHSVIDSIDESSLEFGKDVLKSIKRDNSKSVLGRDYVQVSNNTFVKRFL